MDNSEKKKQIQDSYVLLAGPVFDSSFKFTDILLHSLRTYFKKYSKINWENYLNCKFDSFIKHPAAVALRALDTNESCIIIP